MAARKYQGKHPQTISKACQGSMHMSCDGCACRICHHTCSRCGRPCRVLHAGDICALCRMNDIQAATPKVRARCQNCGGPSAYRDTRSGDDSYLCTACHKSAGHRYQVNGEWVSP